LSYNTEGKATTIERKQYILSPSIEMKNARSAVSDSDPMSTVVLAWSVTGKICGDVAFNA